MSTTTAPPVPRTPALSPASRGATTQLPATKRFWTTPSGTGWPIDPPRRGSLTASTDVTGRPEVALGRSSGPRPSADGDWRTSAAAPARHRVAVVSGRNRGRIGERSETPSRVGQDAGASLIRQSPQQKRTVTRGYHPPIRVRPAPSFEPPFADEPGADEWYREAAGQLAFDFAALTRRPDPAPLVHDGQPPGLATPPEPRLAPSPEARRAAGRFARACLEILNGYRPVAHVRSLSQPAIAHKLIEQLLDALRRMPVTPAMPRRQQQPELVKLRRLRISEPASGVVEAAAALGTDARTWAMAFRLEHTSTRWLGTVLQVL